MTGLMSVDEGAGVQNVEDSGAWWTGALVAAVFGDWERDLPGRGTCSLHPMPSEMQP